MNLQDFDVKYSAFKGADKISITCDHPLHSTGEVVIGKQPARRNILKSGGMQFICRNCMMKYDNPMNKIGESRQTDEIIVVSCPDSRHEGDIAREMKKSHYYGAMVEPYTQICKSCAQRDKIISEQQKQAISNTLKGIKRSDEFKKKISEYMKHNIEGVERGKRNLIAGYSGGWNRGIPLSIEWKKAISDGSKGKSKTHQHRNNISIGRKLMLTKTGGFTIEHREKLSKAVLEQYKNGFDPQLHHRSGYHESPLAGKVFYRSSYEKKAYMLLDSRDDVEFYKTESIGIPYFHPKKRIVSHYLVDIEITFKDGKRKLLEIKPLSRLTDPIVQAKLGTAMEYAKELNCDFEVWTEADIFGSVNVQRVVREFVEWLDQFTQNIKRV